MGLIFEYIGILTTITIVGTILICTVVALYHAVKEHRETKKYNYRIAHRFDGEPKAKCYCIDCQYCYGEPTESGSGVHCRLFGGRIVIKDNSFCYRAEPRKKGGENK